MESSVKLHSLSLKQIRTYTVVALMVAGNMIFPAVCHLVPGGGLTLLPIYFFTLLGAYKYGIRAGLLIAVLSPLANHFLTGMPPAAVLPSILVKSTLIAFAASSAARRFAKVSIAVLAGVVLVYQFAGTAFEWAWTGSLYTALQDFRMAVPGMLLQVFGVWGILKIAGRYGH